MLGLIRPAVAEVYRTQLGVPVEWTPEQTEWFFDRLARDLEDAAGDLAMELKAGAINAWTQRHGDHPDYLTTVQLTNTALANAASAVVRRWADDRLPWDPNDEAEPPRDLPLVVRGVPWEQRWADPRYRCEPTSALEDFADEIWPPGQFSAVFRVLAAYLLATRLEDGQPLPPGVSHPLTAALTAAVNECLERIGYPPEGTVVANPDQLLLFTAEEDDEPEA